MSDSSVQETLPQKLGVSAHHMRILQFALIVLVSVLDVRVRARTLEDPKNCAQEKKCAIHSENSIETLMTSSAKIKITPGATIIREPDESVKVVRGVVKVTAKPTSIVRTLYGDLQVTDGDVLIEAADSVVKFTNLSAQLIYTPRGEKQGHSLPIGFSNYLAGITKSGVADTGYPHPAEIQPLIKTWGRVFVRAEKSSFANDLKKFMQIWHQATRLVGPWYVSIVQREIAAHEAEEARLARLKAEREAEENKYRIMFRKRQLE